MNDAIKFLGLPIFLLVSTWTAYGTVLKLFEQLNAIRDAVLGLRDPGKSAPLHVRRHIMWSDWFGLWIGFVFAMCIYGMIFVLVPVIFAAVSKERAPAEPDPWFEEMNRDVFCGMNHVQIGCYGIGALAFATAAGILIGGYADLRLMRRETSVISGGNSGASSGLLL